MDADPFVALLIDEDITVVSHAWLFEFYGLAVLVEPGEVGRALALVGLFDLELDVSPFALRTFIILCEFIVLCAT